MPTVVISFAGEASLSSAKKLAEGVTEAGALAILTKTMQDADLYFLDASNVPNFDFSNRKIALYALGELAEKKIEEAKKSLENSLVIESIKIRTKRVLLFEKPDEDELIRVKGFGEKTTNKALGQFAFKNKSKNRIKGYRK